MILSSNSLHPARAESTQRSTFYVYDGYYMAKWKYEFSHPDQFNCLWGKGEPTERGVLCSFSANFSWSWSPDSLAVVSKDYPCDKPCSRTPSASSAPYNLPFFDILNSDGKNVTYEYAVVPNNGNDGSNPLGTVNYGRYGSSGSIPVIFAFTYYGPTSISITPTRTRMYSSTNRVTFAESNSFKIVVNGKSFIEAQAEYAKIQNAAKTLEIEKAQQELKRVQSIKFTIECKQTINGKVSLRKIAGDPPRCPKGTSNTQDKYLTYKAFVGCKLYKRDSKDIGYVLLKDNGRTLSFRINERSFSGSGPSYPKYDDLDCAFKSMKIPSYISDQVMATRGIDGRINQAFGKLKISWTFDYNSGLDISFYNS